MTEHERLIITKYDLLFEQRMTRVETTLESLCDDVKEIKKEIKTDFRWILGIMLGSNAGLFAIIAHGFKWF